MSPIREAPAGGDPAPAAPRTMTRRSALVTGASGGIGAELARVLAEHGYDLVLVARSAEPLTALGRLLEETHGVRVQVLPADLSQPWSAERLWARVAALGVAVDVLVNNAGVGLYGLVADQGLDSIEAMIELNVTSLVVLTRLALPDMVARGWGRVLNLASVVSFQSGGPRMAAYFATKAFVLSFTRGLGPELRGTGVRATALCPGPTTTSFQGHADLSRTPLYRWLAVTTARATAEAAYRGMERGRSVVVPGLLTRVLAFAGQFSPASISLEVNRWLLTPTGKR